jgi:hypothetical protein
MKYRAIFIKNWIVAEYSPLGWSKVITTALPELLEYNHRFSAYYVNQNTMWNQTEVDIIQYYLKTLYGQKIPSNQLIDNSEMELDYASLLSFDINFFDSGKTWNSIKQVFTRFFKK